MNESGSVASAPPRPPVPSLAKIAVATAAALVVAVVLLLVAILPAEYGIDPLGTGKVLGLMDLAEATPQAAPVAIPEAAIVPMLGPPAASSNFGPAGPQVTGAFISQPKRYKLDSREMVLDPGEGMEIKYNMKKGGGLIYSWSAEQPLLFEFHGQPNVRPPDSSRDYFESYELGDKVGKRESHGTFVAPSTGIHGWYWQNTSAEPVKLKLVSAGFYDWIQENRHEKQTALDPIDPS
jgi:hypothetical protein